MQSVPAVGVFDSGVGGLSVLGACLRALPGVRFYYYGDNARAPYGTRPREQIAAFTEEALRGFERRGVCAAVLACNTATAACLEEMREKFAFPILGVEPAVALAARTYESAAVLATPFTAQSERLKGLIARFPKTRFEIVSLPRLAEAVEAHFLRGAPLSLEEHLPPRGDVCCAVLGCTHYSLIRREIAHFWGIDVLDGAEGTADHLKRVILLGTNGHQQPHMDTNECFTTKCNKNGQKSVIFLGKSGRTNENLFISNVCFRSF